MIHDHMRTWLPEFDDLDFSMPVNIDVAGECNAFYDGSASTSTTWRGCNATSLIADVVYHEYGHAINDFFYQSYFANFSNGAMNEGYADLWAMSLGDIAEIGKGSTPTTRTASAVTTSTPRCTPRTLSGKCTPTAKSSAVRGTTPTCSWGRLGPNHAAVRGRVSRPSSHGSQWF